MTKKQTAYWLKVAVIGIALGLALQFVRAWTEPTSVPPGGNVGAPINTGPNAQTKAGGISSSSYFSAPVICLNGDCRAFWPSAGAYGCYWVNAADMSSTGGSCGAGWYVAGILPYLNIAPGDFIYEICCHF